MWRPPMQPQRTLRRLSGTSRWYGPAGSECAERAEVPLAKVSRRPSSPDGRGAQLTGSSVGVAKAPLQARAKRSAKGGAPSADDDLDPTVLRFAHTRTSRHKQMRVAEALNGDGILRHTVLDQLDLHRARTTERETLVVFGRA